MRQKQREDDQEGLPRMDANDEKGVPGTLDDELGAADNVQVVLDGEGLQGMDDDITVKEIDRKQREDDQEGLPRMDGDDEKGVPAGILDDELGAADNSQVVLDDEGLQGMKDDIAVNEIDQVVTYEATPDEMEVAEILRTLPEEVLKEEERKEKERTEKEAMHSEASQKGRGRKGNISQAEKPPSCMYCDRKFSSIQVLSWHYKCCRQMRQCRFSKHGWKNVRTRQGGGSAAMAERIGYMGLPPLCDTKKPRSINRL